MIHLVVGLRSPSVKKSAISPPRFADLGSNNNIEEGFDGDGTDDDLAIEVEFSDVDGDHWPTHLQTDSENAGLLVARPKR